MSTKATLVHGDNFHFYSECFDYDNVYVELENCKFTVTNNLVTVAIPLEIWEKIRYKTIATFDLADKTDKELRADAEWFVSKRLNDIKQIEDAGREPGILKMAGFLVYGSADEPIGDQIEKGVIHLKEERRKQQELRKKING